MPPLTCAPASSPSLSTSSLLLLLLRLVTETRRILELFMLLEVVGRIELFLLLVHHRILLLYVTELSAGKCSLLGNSVIVGV